MNALLNATSHVNGDQPTINGRGLPHLKLTGDELVRLAADLVTGERQLKPSLSQVNKLTGVSVAAIRAEIKARSTARTLTADDALVAAWDDASEHERELAVRTLGVAAVWDVISRVVA